MGRQLKVLLLVGSLVPTASTCQGLFGDDLDDDDGCTGQQAWKLKLYEKGSGCAGEAYLGKVIGGQVDYDDWDSGCEDVPLADERAVHFTECTLEHATLSVYSSTGCPTDAALEERTVPISNYDEGSECVEGLFDDLDAIIMCPSAYYGVMCEASAGVTFVPIDESDCSDAYLEGIVTNVLRGDIDTLVLNGCGKRTVPGNDVIHDFKEDQIAGCGEICEASGECGIANISNCEVEKKCTNIYRKVCDPNATVPTFEEIIAGISPNDDATIPPTFLPYDFEGVTLPPAAQPIVDILSEMKCNDEATAYRACLFLPTKGPIPDYLFGDGWGPSPNCDDVQQWFVDRPCKEGPTTCQTEYQAYVACTFEIWVRIYHGLECEFYCSDAAATGRETSKRLCPAGGESGEPGALDSDGARKTTALGALLGTALLL